MVKRSRLNRRTRHQIKKEFFVEERRKALLGLKFAIGFLIIGGLGWILFLLSAEGLLHTVGLVLGGVFTMGGVYALAIFLVRFLNSKSV
jgi:hypothetical protein